MAEGQETALEKPKQDDKLSEANAVYEDYEYKVNTDGKTVTITNYKGAGGNVVIPDTIYGKKVTVIGELAFAQCTSLKSIKIPNSVKQIDRKEYWIHCQRASTMCNSFMWTVWKKEACQLFKRTSKTTTV